MSKIDGIGKQFSNIFCRIGSSLNIFREVGKYTYNGYESVSDDEALKSDWEAVGNDFRQVIKGIEKDNSEMKW